MRVAGTALAQERHNLSFWESASCRLFTKDHANASTIG
ncbi:hypothetical protein TRICHSKD4_2649 [Roseibium sp. TrichSKD4]|nr:hypothetical protein TRICHSKD4_2649 [Roseibium sp. TrichSKD4]